MVGYAFLSIELNSAKPETDCGGTCTGNTQASLAESIPCYRGGEKKSQQLCCPLNATPDPSLCRWSVGLVANALGGFACVGTCRSDEILIAENDNYKVGSNEASCFLGSTAKYCCQIVIHTFSLLVAILTAA